MYLRVTADLSSLEETEQDPESDDDGLEDEEVKEERPPPPPPVRTRGRHRGGAGAGAGGPDEAAGGGGFNSAAAAARAAADSRGRRRRRRGGVTRSYPLKEVESVDSVTEKSGWGGGDGVSALLIIRLKGDEQVRAGRDLAKRRRPLLFSTGVCTGGRVSPSFCSPCVCCTGSGRGLTRARMLCSTVLERYLSKDRDTMSWR